MKKGIVISLAVIITAGLANVLKSLVNNEITVTFITTTVERSNISNTVTATGTIKALVTVKVGTQVSGILKDIYVDFNDTVRKGQVLARIDETSLKTQFEESQAQVDQAQAQFAYYASTYNRFKVLYEKNLVSRSDFDLAVYNYENSKASLANAISSLARSKANLDYATITSPIDGIVLNKAVEEGQTVAASFNTPELFTIVNDLTRMEVQAHVDEADIGKIKQGQRVEFSVDAYPNLKFEANVSEVRLQPVKSNNVVTYDVILSAPNPDKKLMPGMIANATIYVEEKANVLTLPDKAFMFSPDTDLLKKFMPGRNHNMGKTGTSAQKAETSSPQKTSDLFSGVSCQLSQDTYSDGMIPGHISGKKRLVWVKDKQSGLRLIPVVTGIENGTSVEILTGLNEGDEVILSVKEITKKPFTTGAAKLFRPIPDMTPGYGG